MLKNNKEKSTHTHNNGKLNNSPSLLVARQRKKELKRRARTWHSYVITCLANRWRSSSTHSHRHRCVAILLLATGRQRRHRLITDSTNVFLPPLPIARARSVANLSIFFLSHCIINFIDVALNLTFFDTANAKLIIYCTSKLPELQKFLAVLNEIH